jgi:hypothetical protein
MRILNSNLFLPANVSLPAAPTHTKWTPGADGPENVEIVDYH